MLFIPDPAVMAFRLALFSVVFVNPVKAPKVPTPPVGVTFTVNTAGTVASLHTSVGLAEAHSTVGSAYTLAVVLVLFLQPFPSV